MGDGRMILRLKALEDEPRGGAWPSSARAARCPVKSGNERDLCPLLLLFSSESKHTAGTAVVTQRKVQATVGLYAPNLMGYTRATMAGTMGCDSERGSQTSKPGPSTD